MTDDDILAPSPAAEASAAEAAPCPTCQKPAPLCLCAEITRLDNRIALLVLQHPQEQDKLLGTALLACRHLRRADFRIGLSWPSLAKVLGRPADPKRWAVLYLGSAKAEAVAPEQEVVALDHKGAAMPDQAKALSGLHGVIVLDGTWSQAKALWWRNPWLLKCQRVILGPTRPSRYGRLRYEPRRDSLSTLEAIGLLLSRLEGRPEIEQALDTSFQTLLSRYRAWHGSSAATGGPKSRPRPDRRRRR